MSEAHHKATSFPTKQDPYMMDSNKLLWHMDRIREWRDGKHIAPILIDIGLTKLCNIKCVYCYGIYQKFDPQHIIPRDVLLRLFYDAPHLGIKALTLTGDGEPTLNPAMYDAITIGSGEGLDIGLATNGVALNDAHIKTILDSTVWTRINLSASNPASYFKIHGRPYFDKVIANCKKLAEYKRAMGSKCTLGFQMVLIPDCLDDVIPLAKIATDLEFDYFVIKQFSDPGTNIPARGYDASSFNHLANAVLKQAETMGNEKTKVIVKWELIERKNERLYPYCIDLPLIFQISGNSKCYPCGYLFNNEDYCYGDLKKQSLKEIIKSEHYWDVIKKISKIHTSKLCKGSCRHDSSNLFITKYLQTPQHINFI